MVKSVWYENLMVVFHPQEPHKNLDAVATIWNPSTPLETGGRDRKIKQKLMSS